MIEGAYLGRPPVNVGLGRRRAVLFGLVHGAGSYSMAAGGFGTVPAMPRTLQATARPSTGTARPAQQRMTELYVSQPGLFKERLQRMFAEPRSKITSFGYQPPVPTVPGA